MRNPTRHADLSLSTLLKLYKCYETGRHVQAAATQSITHAHSYEQEVKLTRNHKSSFLTDALQFTV